MLSRNKALADIFGLRKIVEDGARMSLIDLAKKLQLAGLSNAEIAGVYRRTADVLCEDISPEVLKASAQLHKQAARKPSRKS